MILAAGTANAAGSWGAEVAELQQKLGMDQGANATIGATDPGRATAEPERVGRHQHQHDHKSDQRSGREHR
jgi:hypothetical protein